MPVSRLGYDGYGVRRAGAFTGKATSGGSTHPVGIITRLSADGYGARRAGNFGGKEQSDETQVATEWLVHLFRRRGRR